MSEQITVEMSDFESDLDVTRCENDDSNGSIRSDWPHSEESAVSVISQYQLDALNDFGFVFDAHNRVKIASKESEEAANSVEVEPRGVQSEYISDVLT
ncbi:unnamed protein product [Caenorhabditis sp. 36 PRJEB53466]|nr:unnamed protein product [Caenorhabditis sp. 36 PRJEB53466]